MDSSLIDSGLLLIHMYVPPALIPENLMEQGMGGFYRMLAMAKACRRMRQEDIQVGIAKAFPKKEE